MLNDIQDSKEMMFLMYLVFKLSRFVKCSADVLNSSFATHAGHWYQSDLRGGWH